VKRATATTNHNIDDEQNTYRRANAKDKHGALTGGRLSDGTRRDTYAAVEVMLANMKMGFRGIVEEVAEDVIIRAANKMMAISPVARQLVEEELPELLTLEFVAEKTGLSRERLYKMSYAGQLKVRYIGRSVRIPKEEYLALLKGRTR